MTEVQHDGQVLSGKVLARSALLDVAVVDTATPAAFPALRRGGELVLGEPIVNVGFPLQSLLVATPNLTRGNVSARGALEGSLGQFQFSAPIQPGASGGPVVSDGGELLGIAVGTLNAARLIEKGVLPQNVQLALEARYAAQFMRAHGIEFTEVEPDAHGDSRRGNDAALAAVVRLACYQ
ncbi:MAG: serine protease [Steroidobacteraceae bacterium]